MSPLAAKYKAEFLAGDGVAQMQQIQSIVKILLPSPVQTHLPKRNKTLTSWADQNEHTHIHQQTIQSNMKREDHSQHLRMNREMKFIVYKIKDEFKSF